LDIVVENARKTAMAGNEELLLYIKSQYPLVYFEAIDEPYAIRQIAETADELFLPWYLWSISEGLKRGEAGSPLYDSTEPVKMLGWIAELIKPAGAEPALFVLKDFEKHLSDTLVLRLFRDLIHRIRLSRTTFVILSAGYQLPRELEPDSARLFGGFPSEADVVRTVRETLQEIRRTTIGAKTFPGENEIGEIGAALKGLSLPQIRNVVNACLLSATAAAWSRGEIERQKKKIFDREGLLEFYLTETRENVAGFSNLKNWLSHRKNSFSASCASALPPPKGVLLMGVQGCGKSLMVRVIARELNLPLYRLDLARLYSKYIGETEENLRKALAIVDKLSPLCLWIDEIEKGLAASGAEVDGGVSQRIMGTFLTWMQERRPGCFIAATANNVERLPPELLRQGRFDEAFFIDLPGEAERVQILAIHLKKRGADPDRFDLRRLTELTQGFTGAEIEQAIISALYRAQAENRPLADEHLSAQIASTKPLSVPKGAEIAALRAWARDRTVPA